MELTIKKALQQGVAAHREGKLQDAERLYLEILQLQPAHPDANHNLGLIAVSVNQANVALPLFKIALEVNPKIEQFWLSYIDALIRENQIENAKLAIEQAKRQDVDGEKLKSLEAQLSPETQNPNTVRVSPPQQQLNSLLEYCQTGQYGEAKTLAVSLTVEFPKHQFAWKILGVVLGKTGEIPEALGACQMAVALSAQDAEAHNNLAGVLDELGRLKDAEASYKRAITLMPNYARAHYNLGLTLQKLGSFDEAIASYTQASLIDPKNPDFYALRGLTPSLISRGLLVNRDDVMKSINDGDWASSELLLKKLCAETPEHVENNVAEFIGLWCDLCRYLVNQGAIKTLIPIIIKLVVLAERNKDFDNLIQLLFENFDIDKVLKLVEPEDTILIKLSYCQYKFLNENFFQAEAIAIEIIQNSVSLIKASETEDLGWLAVRRSLASCTDRGVARIALSTLYNNLVD